jgi:hypothetical protein
MVSGIQGSSYFPMAQVYGPPIWSGPNWLAAHKEQRYGRYGEVSTTLCTLGKTRAWEPFAV